jgi:uncharacterized membrane protein YraQ (UPF0718 family)
MWNTLNDIFLKMTWLDSFFDTVVYDWIQLDRSGTLGGIVHFFLYDTVKILLLLVVLIYAVSWIQSHFPPERTARILTKMRGVRGNVTGALLGTLTPFCSCSSIPIFIGFTKAGLPIGVTFSFLISSPLVDLASFLILMSFLGWQIALAYVVVGIVLAVIGGILMDKMGMERHIQDYVKDLQHVPVSSTSESELTWKDRHDYAWMQVLDILRRVWIYVLIGVGIGATIHNVIPEAFVQRVIGRDNPFSVLLATIVGIPMYADIFGTIPIAEALLGKGVGVGTVLSFMMAVTALSLPSLILLKQVVKPKGIVVFTTIVTTGILLMGWLFNTLDWIGG